MKHVHILILLLSFSVVFSQENSSSFTLQQAIDYAIENNRTVKNAALDIVAAKKQKWETTATGLPQIGATIDYINNIKQQFGPVDFNGDGVPDFGAKQSINAQATINQLLFDGTYIVALQASKVFLDVSKNAKEKTDLEIRKAVINAYGSVLLAKESVVILENNITILRKNLNDIIKIYENGLEEEESVEQLKITLSGIESNLNNSIRLKDITYKMLNMVLGRPIDSQITVTDNLNSLVNKNIVLELLDIENQLENTIDYRIADNERRVKELMLKLEKNKALPIITAFLNGGYVGNSQKFTFLNDNQIWFGTAAFGGRITIPIFGVGLQSASTQRARINLEKSKIDLIETQERIKLEIASAKSNYKFAVEDYNNKKDNLTLAKRIEQKNQTKFFEGIASSFELRQAQTQLYQAQNELLQSMLDVINEKAALETVLNQTPEN